jgi:deoxyribodipyrimidine photo-lyase
MKIAMALFTRDLRVRDNPVLTAAHRLSCAVAPIFVLDDAILASNYLTPNKAAFLTSALCELNDELKRIGGQLILRRGQLVAEVVRLVNELSITEVHVAADVSDYSQRREKRLNEALRKQDCRLIVHAASVTVCDPGEITPAGSDHFAVFTPYYRRWSQTLARKVLAGPRSLKVPKTHSEPLPDAGQLCLGKPSPQLAVGGETTGRRMLQSWLAGPVDGYDKQNDDLAADATSRFSPYLHFGCLSPNEVVQRTGRSGAGREAFVRQIAWRDFHHQVLAARPDAAQRDYRGRSDAWRHEPQLLDAWRRGRTGYPIVDAGMRQLAAEGWMHNRARLITGSFLTKTMYLDWRQGAAHFMSLLVDGDISNNQLNWQWVAGTGTDTRPNRVLNPQRQAERYDPAGDYVRRWIPELAHIQGAQVHAPWELETFDTDYPNPVVDHREGARRFKAARSGSRSG